MSFLVISSIASNVIAAVGVILVNKWVLVINKFPYTTVLCCVHYYASFLACCLLLLCGVFKYKPASKFDYIVRITLGALSSTVFMNLNLSYNSIVLYQLSKLLSIPVTLAIETMLNKRQQDMTIVMIGGLTMIMIGVGLFVLKDGDYSSHVIGYVYAALAVLSTSLSQIFFGPLQRELDLNPLQLLYFTSPLLTLASFMLIPVFENTQQLMKVNMSGPLIVNLSLSCLGAVVLNITNYYVLSNTTPLTYLVLGHIKTVLIVLIGYFFFEKTIPSPQIIVGVSTAMCGVIVYSWENLRQQQERKNKTLPTSR